MDLSFLKQVLAGASTPAKVPEVASAKEPCQCGHLEEDHSAGDCDIADCECISYFPVSHAPVAIATEKVNNSSQDLCCHKCIACGKFWSHGAANKCRHPEVLDAGQCMNCLNDPTARRPGVKEVASLPPDTHLDKEGRLVLDEAYQVKIRNKTRQSCKDMTSAQLSFHILVNAKMIEELKADSLESRRMRSEVEEAELESIPEADREEFRRALRKGTTSVKAVKEKKEKKEKKESKADQERGLQQQIVASGRTLAEAKVIASWMLKMGKTQKEVEGFLYGTK